MCRIRGQTADTTQFPSIHRIEHTVSHCIEGCSQPHPNPYLALCHEGGHTSQEVEEQNAYSPPVHCMIVSRLHHCL
jgi:hypothetical protein